MKLRRTLIVEDGAPAREVLRELLEARHKIEIIGKVDRAVKRPTFIANSNPAFLFIRGNGLEKEVFIGFVQSVEATGEICEQYHGQNSDIHVTEAFALFGLGNSDLVCDFLLVKPPSIDMNSAGLSYRAAQELLRVRLGHAERLLSTTDKSIEVISKECGFPSRISFSNTFVGKSQLRPGKFRSKHCGNNGRNSDWADGKQCIISGMGR